MKEFNDETISQAFVEEEPVAKEKVPEPDSKSDSFLLWIIVGLVLAVIAFFVSNWAFDYLSVPKTIDDLHQDTLAGTVNENQFMFNGHSFVKDAGLWWFEWKKGNNLYDVSLRFNPREAASVPIKGNGTFEASSVYISFDPYKQDLSYTALAATALSLNLFRALNVNASAACTSEHPDCVGRPIMTCENHTGSLIVVEEGSYPTEVIVEDNCIILHGEKMEIMRALDRVLYKWYDVLE